MLKRGANASRILVDSLLKAQPANPEFLCFLHTGRSFSALRSLGSPEEYSEKQFLKIQDDPLYAHDMWVVRDGTKKPTDLVPYWSSDLKTYSFQADLQGKGYCGSDPKKILGGCDFNTNPSTVDICPSAFTVKAKALKLGGRNGASSYLEDILSRSTTLLHESWHVVHTENSTDASCMDGPTISFSIPFHFL